MDNKLKNIEPLFNNAQIEIIKLFHNEMKEDTLKELKDLISDFLLEKSISEAEKAFKEKGLTNNKISELTGIDIG